MRDGIFAVAWQGGEEAVSEFFEAMHGVVFCLYVLMLLREFF